MTDAQARPDFLIVGAPKSGTTAIYRYLREHPGIFMPWRKEIPFFDTDLELRHRERLNKDEYLALFEGVDKERRIGDANVWYLYSRDAARNIREFCGPVDIIIMLRHPVDMLYSQHREFLYNANEHIEDFAEALAAEEDRRRGCRIPDSAHRVESLFYRKTARFTDQVRRYFETFGRDRTHVILFDDFRVDAAREYRKTLRFLDVDPTFTPDLEVVNPNREVRSLPLQRLLKNRPALMRRLARMILPSQKVRRRVFNALMALNSEVTEREPLDSGVRRTLEKEFMSEIHRLGELLDRDLTHWTA